MLENVRESTRIRCYIHKSVYNFALFLIDALCVSVPVARPCLLRLHHGYSCGNVTNLSRLIIYTNSPELMLASSLLPLLLFFSPYPSHGSSISSDLYAFDLFSFKDAILHFLNDITHYTFVKKSLIFCIVRFVQAFVIRKFMHSSRYERYAECIITISRRLCTVIFLTFKFFLSLIKRKTRKNEKKLAGVRLREVDAKRDK